MGDQAEVEPQADTEFPVGRGAHPRGGGRQHTNLPDFPKKLHGSKVAEPKVADQC